MEINFSNKQQQVLQALSDKENRNYDHYYYKMRDEILNG